MKPKNNITVDEKSKKDEELSPIDTFTLIIVYQSAIIMAVAVGLMSSLEYLGIDLYKVLLKAVPNFLPPIVILVSLHFGLKKIKTVKYKWLVGVLFAVFSEFWAWLVYGFGTIAQLSPIHLMVNIFDPFYFGIGLLIGSFGLFVLIAITFLNSIKSELKKTKDVLSLLKMNIDIQEKSIEARAFHMLSANHVLIKDFVDSIEECVDNIDSAIHLGK